MSDLSVLIPARNEKYLQQTIDDVLAHSELDTEVIVVCDGGWPEQPIPDDPRVVIIHHTEPRGQRASINEAARIARGRFLMKLDAHCAVSKGFDRQLIADWQPGWTLVPLMYNLDPETFTPKLHKATRAMYLGLNEKGELRAEYYSRQPRFDSPIHETMACMGPGWFLSKEDFWRTGGCDEGHGGACGWGAQSVEVSCKAWLSGGALMTDENCWFAHHFRGGEGFPYPISGREVQRVREYSKDLWLNDRWPGQVRPFRWLVEKFSPPGWEGHVWEDHELVTAPEPVPANLHSLFYRHVVQGRRLPRWRGAKTIKLPEDMILYAEVIQQNRPRWIVEAGTAYGGSSLFYQDMLDLVGAGGRVITIDKYPQPDVPHDPRITYLTGGSTAYDVLETVRAMVGTDSVMVILDSDHHRAHVKRELARLAPFTTPGQFCVVEDCYRRERKDGPGEAVDWFLATRQGRAFEQTNLDRRFLVGFCRGGWLRRR